MRVRENIGFWIAALLFSFRDYSAVKASGCTKSMSRT